MKDDVIDGELVEETWCEHCGASGPRGGGCPHGTTPVRAAPAQVEYEIVIRDTTFTESYSWMTVEFEAIGAPVLSYSKLPNPILRASVPLRQGNDPSKRLSAGAPRTSSATGLARGGGAEYDFGGFSSLPVQQVPEQPSDEEILAACRRELQRHLDEVEKERARLAVTENHGLIGRRFKVKA